MAKHSLMFICAITPLHNGAGEGLGLVDNPIMRERTTLFPIIQSTSIKGVLRDAFGADKDPNVQALFGPPPGKGDSHGGAVSFSDGQILAFPVRSLKGIFVWATSPLILYRLHRNIELAGLTGQFPKLTELLRDIDSSFNNTPNKARICPSGKNYLLIKDRLILEEFPKIFEVSNKLEEFAKEISPKLFDSSSSFLKSEFEKKLVLLTEDSFRHFATNATEIMPNIRIGENGTTETGSLRYTEFLPSETVLYTFISFEKANQPKDDDVLLNLIKEIKVNKTGTELNFDDGDEWVKALFEQGKPSVIQIGGDETTGKGVVQLMLV